MTRTDPYHGFRFIVQVDQVIKGGFSRVRGLARETQMTSYREGGVNDHEHKLAGVTTYGNLVLERGLADPFLYVWHQAVIEGLVKRKLLTVTLRDETGSDAWSWNVLDAYPVKWATSDLDAASGQVATEAVEFAHHGFLLRPGLGGVGL